MKEEASSPAYIKNVRLKGYKSIIDMEVRLNKGLNIIIGKNGSGKTNFVEFMSNIFSPRTNAPILSNQYFFEIKFNSLIGHFMLQESLTGPYNNSDDLEEKSDLFKTVLEDNNSEKFENKGILNIRGKFTAKSGVFKLFNPTHIRYVTNFNYETYMLSELGQLVVDRKENLKINIIDYLFENNFYDGVLSRGKKSVVDYIGQNIDDFLILKKSLIENLKQYSPIQNLRLSPSLSKEITTNKIEIKYIILEFYVNNQWLDWSQLSDGTRRIFNIISTINGSDRHLTFLEEPENGVHPDQLYLLMDFIKEQSKEKQIIITTHSPEVLNILGKEELDNIIVTRFDDEKGTQMHHLSAEKIKKGIAYMSEEGLALKDFWVNSNLEEFDEDEEN